MPAVEQSPSRRFYSKLPSYMRPSCVGFVATDSRSAEETAATYETSEARLRRLSKALPPRKVNGDRTPSHARHEGAGARGGAEGGRKVSWG